MMSMGMVQVGGTTYRIVEKPLFNEVVRLLDDRVVAAFRHVPTLEVLHSSLPADTLLHVVREARATARLTWHPPRAEQSRARSRVAGLFGHGGAPISWSLSRVRQLVPSGALSLLHESRR